MCMLCRCQRSCKVTHPQNHQLIGLNGLDAQFLQGSKRVAKMLKSSPASLDKTLFHSCPINILPCQGHQGLQCLRKRTICKERNTLETSNAGGIEPAVRDNDHGKKLFHASTMKWPTVSRMTACEDQMTGYGNGWLSRQVRHVHRHDLTIKRGALLQSTALGFLSALTVNIMISDRHDPEAGPREGQRCGGGDNQCISAAGLRVTISATI